MVCVCVSVSVCVCVCACVLPSVGLPATASLASLVLDSSGGLLDYMYPPLCHTIGAEKHVAMLKTGRQTNS